MKSLPVRERLYAQQARRIELMNQKTTGELVPADQVEAQWSRIVARVKTRLAMIPRRVEAAHPGNRPVIETLERELNAALAALADDQP